MMNSLDCNLLISCCGNRGALYRVTIRNQAYQWVKIADGQFRGITCCGNQFLILGDQQILLFNEQMKPIKHSKILGTADYHGARVIGNLAYVVETGYNAIGIYNIENLEIIGKIRFSQLNYDVNHVNDIYIEDDSLFVSMFSLKEPWRNKDGLDGVILEYSLKEDKVIKIHYRQLSQPHSVLYYKGDLFYCNSREFEVKQEGKLLFKAQSFTRGLAVTDQFLFVGQSLSRNMNTKQFNEAVKNNIKCGIHIIDRFSQENLFIPLPSVEVYGILLY
jgi:hypothetical protein